MNHAQLARMLQDLGFDRTVMPNSHVAFTKGAGVIMLPIAKGAAKVREMHIVAIRVQLDFRGILAKSKWDKTVEKYRFIKTFDGKVKPSKRPKTKDLLSDFYTFWDQVAWVACWRRYDLMAQGKTEGDAIKNLWQTIALSAVWDAMDGHLPTFGTATRVTPKQLREMQQRHKDSHKGKTK